MKTDTRHRTTFGTRLRFLVRVLGLFGVLAVAAGAVVAVPSFPPAKDIDYPFVRKAIDGDGRPGQQLAALLLLGGGAAIALWLLVEFVGVLASLTGRKTASGANAAVQTALAVALLAAVNAISFSNYWRWDQTRDKQFTLDADLQKKLAKLDPKSPTTIVAVRVHKSASIAPDRSDNYDTAAERKVLEKVRDLTDELREFGPRFDVHVLDIEDEDYAERLGTIAGTKAPFVLGIDPDWAKQVAADAKAATSPPEAVRKASAAFTAAIAAAPENSIFFAANGKFQRLPFNEFMLYDKTASKADRNLVLLPQGKTAFVEKLLSLEVRKPVVGVAVVHEALSTRSEREISLPALRTTLERNGFEVKDVILKSWGRQLSPAARTFGEDEFARTEGQFNLYSLAVTSLEAAIRRREKATVEADGMLKLVDEAIAKNDRSTAIKHLEAAIDQLQEFERRRIVNPLQARAVLEAVAASVPSLKQELDTYREKLAAVRPKYDELVKNDRLLEARRSGDVKDRLKQFVDSCDVLIVPRLTVMQLARGEAIQAWLHNWSGEQAEVLKAFVASGKPVLFAVGATAVDKQRAGREPPDKAFDDLLARFGVTLGDQAIFTDDEGDVVAESEDDSLGRGAKVPPLRLTLSPDADALRAAAGGLAEAAPPKPTNPLADALTRSGRIVDGDLPIRRSGFRPIYLSDGARAKLPYAGGVAATGKTSWNEDKPLPEPEDNYFPRFNPTKLGDPAKGTRDEERRGPFDVAVALEAPIPDDWLEPKLNAAQAGSVVAGMANLGLGFPTGLPVAALPPDQFLVSLPEGRRPKPPTVRLVVLGHGGLFTGTKMEPGEEALLLHSLNWQLRRDDKLPKPATGGDEWKYPRVQLDPVKKAAWTGGAVALLPLTCAVFGVIVLMVRRFR